ncbi:MAG: protocatechuate 3,4-dioxygenase subunit alpha [Alphaproteobacteria bacterium]|nr:protocatechuate 3,4-dioxygenase subunit alpha [Alphaproteobacteria bacterium]
MALKQTPSQTVGPFFAYGLTPEQYGYGQMTSIASSTMASADTDGTRIRVEGRVFDADGAIVPDAMIEVWQADAQGRHAHPADGRGSNAGFSGFGRMGTGTDPQNRFIFDTIKPGTIGDGQAPHLNLIVFMRGMPLHAYTRVYFPDDAEANAGDPVLALVPEERHGTLIAEAREGADGHVYVFDIHLRGDKETVFFDA